MVKKFFAAAILAVVAVFALPLAANAAGYVPSSNVAVSDSTPAPGESVTISFAATSYLANENVGFTLTGENGASATLASFRAAVTSKSISKPASATGAISVSVTLPSNASGTYTVTATGATSGNVGTAALTVVPADGGSPSTGDALASTGSNTSFFVIWIAAGIVVLGLAFVVVSVIVRRQRSSKA